MYYLERSMEVLSDLENANILGCILAHYEDFDDNPRPMLPFSPRLPSSKAMSPTSVVTPLSILMLLASFYLAHQHLLVQ
jgi:hypothetical protein